MSLSLVPSPGWLLDFMTFTRVPVIIFISLIPLTDEDWTSRNRSRSLEPLLEPAAVRELNVKLIHSNKTTVHLQSAMYIKICNNDGKQDLEDG